MCTILAQTVFMVDEHEMETSILLNPYDTSLINTG